MPVVRLGPRLQVACKQYQTATVLGRHYYLEHCGSVRRLSAAGSVGAASVPGSVCAARKLSGSAGNSSAGDGLSASPESPGRFADVSVVYQRFRLWNLSFGPPLASFQDVSVLCRSCSFHQICSCGDRIFLAIDPGKAGQSLEFFVLSIQTLSVQKIDYVSPQGEPLSISRRMWFGLVESSPDTVILCGGDTENGGFWQRDAYALQVPRGRNSTLELLGVETGVGASQPLVVGSVSGGLGAAGVTNVGDALEASRSPLASAATSPSRARRLSDLPAPVCAFALQPGPNRTVLCMGGYSSRPSRAVFMYRPNSDAWAGIPPMLCSARGYHATVVARGRYVVLFGGVVKDKSFWLLDFASGRWGEARLSGNPITELCERDAEAVGSLVMFCDDTVVYVVCKARSDVADAGEARTAGDAGVLANTGFGNAEGLVGFRASEGPEQSPSTSCWGLEGSAFDRSAPGAVDHGSVCFSIPLDELISLAGFGVPPGSLGMPDASAGDVFGELSVSQLAETRADGLAPAQMAATWGAARGPTRSLQQDSGRLPVRSLARSVHSAHPTPEELFGEGVRDGGPTFAQSRRESASRRISFREPEALGHFGAAVERQTDSSSGPRPPGQAGAIENSAFASEMDARGSHAFPRPPVSLEAPAAAGPPTTRGALDAQRAPRISGPVGAGEASDALDSLAPQQVQSQSPNRLDAAVSTLSGDVTQISRAVAEQHSSIASLQEAVEALDAKLDRTIKAIEGLEARNPLPGSAQAQAVQDGYMKTLIPLVDQRVTELLRSVLGPDGGSVTGKRGTVVSSNEQSFQQPDPRGAVEAPLQLPSQPRVEPRLEPPPQDLALPPALQPQYHPLDAQSSLSMASLGLPPSPRASRPGVDSSTARSLHREAGQSSDLLASRIVEQEQKIAVLEGMLRKSLSQASGHASSSQGPDGQQIWHDAWRGEGHGGARKDWQGDWQRLSLPSGAPLARNADSWRQGLVYPSSLQPGSHPNP